MVYPPEWAYVSPDIEERRAVMTGAMQTDVDVLIVGAGLSGIGVACHLSSRLPDKTFAILEARDAIGGTWDLFRYPGIRSDADMRTFGYEFKPWRSENAIADAAEILDYLSEAVEEHGLAPHIRFGHTVLGAVWSSQHARWTVRVRSGEEASELTSRFLFSATGYYDHAQGYRPRFDGEEDFAGPIVHPQHWPEDLELTGRRVIVIGSGATAATLIPAMAGDAAHVTMLQRSPSYVLSVPRRDPIVNRLRRLLPERPAWQLARRIVLAQQRAIYSLSRRHPKLVRRLLRALAKRQLPAGYPVDLHFNPRYEPWDERMCLIPDGDLFAAIKSGRASVVTDRIDRFTDRGILLQSGGELEADIVVTATGLNMLAFGGLELSIDGEQVAVNEAVAYKAMMLSGVPNFAYALGYVNAVWTLKVDLVGQHLCRLLAHMDARGFDTVVPELDDPALERLPYFDFKAGYIQRGMPAFPRRGSHGPWTVPELSYAQDVARLRQGPIEDPSLRFEASAHELALAASGV